MIAALLCYVSFAAAQNPDADEANPETGMLLNVSLGYQQWPALHDLDTQPFGAFDEDGLNLAAGFHVPWTKRGKSELFLGFDLGLMVHESNIVAPGDYGTVETDVFYVAPSLRWKFQQSRRLHMSLEAGVGAYYAEMREWIEIGYDFIAGTRHFESWAPGGFVGLGIDVPVGRTGRWSLSSGVRVHLADFGGIEAFGQQIGSLNGPITTLQLGMTYDWKGR